MGVSDQPGRTSSFSWWNIAVFAGLFMMGIAFAVYTQKERIQPLTLQTLDGGRVALPGNDLSWVNFWSISCPPCLTEMPYLNKLSKEYAGQMQIVAVSVPYDPPNLIKDYQERAQLTLPMALDLDGVAVGQFTENLVVPSHYLLDSKGNVLLTHLGEIDEASIRAAIEKHL